MKVRRSLLKDEVIVSTRTGEGSYGDTIAAPVTVPCLSDETRRLVRDSSGQETISEVTLLVHPRTRAKAQNGSVTVVDPTTIFTPESQVLIGDRTSRVLAVKPLKLRGTITAVEVTCA